MSAFFVSPATIDAIVYTRQLAQRAGYHRGLCEELDDDQLGRMLWRENALSLDARYSDARGSMYDPSTIEAYRFRIRMTVLNASPVALLKNLHHYEYQSCEHEGWSESGAYALCETLSRFLQRRMPGYDTAQRFEEDDLPDPIPLTALLDSRPKLAAPPPPANNGNSSTHVTTADACTMIRDALRQRSALAWSVTHGRGTAYGWITVQAPPKRRDTMGYTSEDDRAELARLFGVDRVHCQGLSISPDERAVYVDRAQGKAKAS